MTSSKVQALEQARGKPLKAILIEVFMREGSTTAAARELGVSQGTISLWLLRCGLEIKSIVIDKEPA